MTGFGRALTPSRRHYSNNREIIRYWEHRCGRYIRGAPMSANNPRIHALERLVQKYEHSIVVFRTINTKLRTLPPSDRVHNLIELNESILDSTLRVLASTRTRLHNARLNTMGLGSASLFAKPAMDTEQDSTATDPASM